MNKYLFFLPWFEIRCQFHIVSSSHMKYLGLVRKKVLKFTLGKPNVRPMFGQHYLSKVFFQGFTCYSSPRKCYWHKLQATIACNRNLGIGWCAMAFQHGTERGEREQGADWPSVGFPWHVDEDVPISQSASGKWLYRGCCDWLPCWGWGSWGFMVFVFSKKVFIKNWETLMDCSIHIIYLKLVWFLPSVYVFFWAINATGVSQIHGSMLFDFDHRWHFVWWSLPGRQEGFLAWIGAPCSNSHTCVG